MKTDSFLETIIFGPKKTEKTEKTDRFSNYGLKVMALVVDNENFCTTLFKILKKEFPFLIHIRCGAHTLQLVINKILEILELKQIVNEGLSIIDLMISKKKLRIELRKLQKVLAAQKIKKIINPNITRGNSKYSAFLRLLELK